MRLEAGMPPRRCPLWKTCTLSRVMAAGTGGGKHCPSPPRAKARRQVLTAMHRAVPTGTARFWRFERGSKDKRRHTSAISIRHGSRTGSISRTACAPSAGTIPRAAMCARADLILCAVTYTLRGSYPARCRVRPARTLFCVLSCVPARVLSSGQVLHDRRQDLSAATYTPRRVRSCALPVRSRAGSPGRSFCAPSCAMV